MKIIDTHTHVWLHRAEDDRRELAECVDDVPLERIYVSGLPGRSPTEEEVVAGNDAVQVFLDACPQARGQVYLNPLHKKQATEELKRRRDAGFVMIKLWTATTANDPHNYPIYEAAIEYGMPVLLHTFVIYAQDPTGQTTPEQFAEAARRYPECTFQMAHMAGGFISGIEAVADLKNVYVDFSGSYGETGMVEYAVERLGPTRIFYGSDMPGSDVYHNLGKVTGADVDDETKERILYMNAAEVLP